MASSTSWGIEGTRLLTPAEVKEMVPFIDETRDPRRLLHAGRRRRRLAPGRHAHAPEGPGDGRADDRRRRRGHRHRRRATAASAGVRTDQGDIEAEIVVIACGVWSPRIARDGRRVDPADAGRPPDDRHRPGADVRSTPTSEVGFPIVRDMDTNMYERQHGDGLRDRLVRPPGDPHGRRRHPVDRGVGAVADDAAVHPGGLRPAARGRARAVPGDRRRRDGRA